MAIYHLRLKVVSRSLGRAPRPGGATRRSAIAAAAYRSGERLYDITQGRWFDFDKPDVVHTEILAPTGAPSWVFDRQTLHNQIERSERRADAQLLREVEVTCPRELSRDQQIDLVRNFVREHYVNRGMVADIAIHCPQAADGLEQPHAHVLLTLRRLDASSPTGFSSTKERDWNEREDVARLVAEARKRFNDTGLEVDKDALDAAEALRNVSIWRAAWSTHANQALEAAGSEARIDHRTLEAQGIFRAPQISLGIARHIEKAYEYVRARVTQWVSIKHRADIYAEVEHYKKRDPMKLTDFVMRLGDMAEEFAASFRKPAHDIPEVDLER
ncbi:ATP-dependent exoDNAse (exonuclease V) alpha subunit [Caulobacter ginsengisoli]|uniref:ATP-dependent exoDNAse (Exonuclease V) alpha subunit n=1 Tax=Caulobacter ginsengisoli TaxID=400775 RepID=A0ABU0ILR3_9CAUL|nr:MobQ family relaxase [Caulobacter ginsengisoli]MDQ0462950.1 ATP-dependent exoDNAse (exonuclease V) alpha subunit [Caulobacter ginsengisoli]